MDSASQTDDSTEAKASTDHGVSADRRSESATLVDPPSADFQKLDVRSVSFHRLVTAISFCVVGALMLVGGIPILIFVPLPWKLLVPLSWCVLGAFACGYTYWYPKWEHERWSYRVAEGVVELRNGVVWQSAVAIPISRLQHVDLHRGPLQKRWGLASLQIHTAGTRDASHQIPGLAVGVARALRDQLIEAANQDDDERATP